MLRSGLLNVIIRDCVDAHKSTRQQNLKNPRYVSCLSGFAFLVFISLSLAVCHRSIMLAVRGRLVVGDSGDSVMTHPSVVSLGCVD